MQTDLHGKMKERRGEWLIGVNTQNVPHLSILATQHKTRKRCVRCLLMRAKACRYADV